MTSPAVHRADRSHQQAIVSAMARAFEDDPFAVFAFPDSGRRLRGLEEMFEANFSISFFDDCEVHTASGCEATAVWAPPDRQPMSDAQQVQIMEAFGRIFGERLAVLGEALGRIEGELKPSEPHWYLEFLGTDPPHQCKGFGSAVIRPVLDRCDKAGEAAYLWTAREANLDFYRRHGFEIVWDWAVPEGPMTWGMWRDPRPAV